MPRTGEHCAIEALESRLLLSAFLLDDVNPKTPQGMNSRVGILGDYVYFGGDDGNFGGKGVWRSDGTEAGTQLFAASVPSGTYVTAGNRLYAGDGSIWVTDGTPQGSAVLTTSTGAAILDASGITAVGNKVFFFRTTSSSPSGLWISDGTSAGTTLVKQGVARSGNPKELFAGNGLFYFVNQTLTGVELWRSDGTTAGTFFLATLNSSIFDHPLLPVGNDFFFAGSTGLWKTDGTVAGTVLVKAYSSQFSTLRQFQNLRGKLAFFSGLNLWVSDGTSAGTVQIKQLYPNNNPNTDTGREFRVLDGIGYFQQPVTLLTGGGRLELWRTDGSPSGTTMVSLIDSSYTLWQDSSTVAGGNLYYWTSKNSLDYLWKIDATGQSIVHDFSNLPWSMKPMLAIGNQTYFQGGDGIHGDELWVTDGTAAGTHMVKDVNAYSAASNPTGFITLGERVLFSASTGPGAGLYRTLGTTDTTEPVRYNGNTVPGAVLATRGDGFVAWLSGGLLKTDGTDEGTVVVDPTPITFNNTRELTYSNGKFFVWGNTTANGSEVWVNDNDGAQHGFHMLDIRPGSSGSMAATPSGFVSYNGNTYFSAFGASGGIGLWKSDGSQQGTSLLGTFSSLVMNATQAIEYNGLLYFIALDANSNRQLWRTDGTPQGTILFANLNMRTSENTPPYFTLLNGKLYFAAGPQVQLWSTDGTLENTAPVPGSPNSVTRIATAYGALYFNSTDAQFKAHIWRYDGSAAPAILKDGAMITPPLEFKGNIWFWGNDGVIHGTELWHSDGTPEGTVILDMTPGGSGTGDSDPSLVALGKRLIFDGFDALHNREPWVYVDDLAPRISSANLDLSGPIYGVVLQFNEAISLNGLDISLENQTTGQVIPASDVVISIEDHSQRLVLTFPNYPNGVLPDGDYRLTLPDGFVVDDASNALTNLFEFKFFFLKGDLNRDRAVTISDFIDLSSNFGKTNATYADGDVNFDRIVSIADFIDLAANFNTSLANPAAAISPQAPAAGTDFLLRPRRLHHRRLRTLQRKQSRKAVPLADIASRQKLRANFAERQGLPMGRHAGYGI